MYINFVMYIKNRIMYKQCYIALQAKFFPELAAGEILFPPSCRSPLGFVYTLYNKTVIFS